MVRALELMLVVALVVLGQMLPTDDQPGVPLASRIPLWLKVLQTAFVCVLVPIYWRYYGPANFLWFSDIALLATVPALWLESSFLASTQAVSVVLLELVWLADFLLRLALGVHIIGLSKYMFQADIPLFLRGLSLFHVWLPFLLLWMLWRLGYHPSAWLAQSAVALVVLTVCFFFTDRSRNINWVFGPGETVQQRMPPALYLLVLMLMFCLCVYLPSHLVLQCLFSEQGAYP